MFERLIDNLIVDEIIIIIIYFPRVDFNILHFCLQVSGLNLLLYRNLWSLMILFNFRYCTYNIKRTFVCKNFILLSFKIHFIWIE